MVALEFTVDRDWDRGHTETHCPSATGNSMVSTGLESKHLNCGCSARGCECVPTSSGTCHCWPFSSAEPSALNFSMRSFSSNKPPLRFSSSTCRYERQDVNIEYMHWWFYWHESKLINIRINWAHSDDRVAHLLSPVAHNCSDRLTARLLEGLP